MIQGFSKAETRLIIFVSVFVFTICMLIYTQLTSLPTESEARNSLVLAHPECANQVSTVNTSSGGFAGGGYVFINTYLVCDAAKVTLEVR